MKRFSSLPKIEGEEQKEYELYCLIDGIYTNVIYEQLAVDGEYYYKKLNVTNPAKLQKQKALVAYNTESTRIVEYVETTTTKPQTGTVTTTNTVNIDPVAVFTYNKYIKGDSGKIDSWNSSYGDLSISQSTADLKPSFGSRAGGRVGFGVPYFDGGVSGANGDYMTFSSSVTLEKDFTIFMYIKPHGKYLRFLGSSSDTDIHLSLHEDSNQYLHFGLGSGKTYTIDYKLVAGGVVSSKETTLLTIQRSGTTLYLRKDGVAVGSVTVAEDDFVFNQLGRKGTETYTMASYISHLSIYNGYIQRNLTDIENSLITESSKIDFS